MARPSSARRGLHTALACLLFAVPCTAAFAADPAAEEEARKIRTSREILMNENGVPTKKGSWLSPNFHLHEKAGLGYEKKLQWGDRPLVLRLRGPVLRKQKAVGLRFNLNF
jgi:hypothetical protein